MTSSDQTRLSPGSVATAAARAGESLAGEARPTTKRLAFVSAKFNGGITERLLEGALDALDAHGVERANISIAWVPGAFEIPLAAMRFATSGEVAAVVTLGAVIRGETPHFDFVAGECARGCQQVALSTGVPVIFGVLTTNDVDQALARCGPKEHNRGYDAALTALEMVDLLGRLPQSTRGTESVI